MCSIAGSESRDDVLLMLKKMEHRSPDQTGVEEVRGFHIGMGRLAIIDTKARNVCPYKDDGFVLAFNGEIYNYKEIRDVLSKKGFKFLTQSDTEVLAKAWKCWGEKMFPKLNGMFAFALYDKGKIVLGRDIAGEKPLYFSQSPFRFASEAKALGFACEEFPPASYGVYERGKLTIRKYWELKKRTIDPLTAEEELEALLEDSVRLRTRSDVPYGLYLSGGVDSSLLATFHDFEHTFTYEDGDFKEEFLSTFPKILWHLDYPVNSFSPFGLWKLAESASKKVKVVISGEGADELFGGYVRYLKPHFSSEAIRHYPSYASMFDRAEDVNEAGWREFNGNLRELLRMGDRMAAAFGMENRCPFLDKRIIEFAFSLPSELKMRGVETKVILNRILRKRNPSYEPIEKAGLYCSVNKWLGVEDKFDKRAYAEYQKEIWEKFRLS